MYMRDYVCYPICVGIKFVVFKKFVYVLGQIARDNFIRDVLLNEIGAVLKKDGNISNYKQFLYQNDLKYSQKMQIWSYM